MVTLIRQKVDLYVSRSTQQWIVRDPDGNFWILPVIDEPWKNRQPFELTDEIELESVPGHYKHMLGLPF